MQHSDKHRSASVGTPHAPLPVDMVQKEDRRINSIIGGKWRVDSLLGTGSMAAVYAVTHRNGVKAALKILHPSLCTDAKVCERFLGEGYLTNSVKHSGIVRVLDDGMTDDGCVFLVMDLLEGTTLELLRQERGGRIDVAETLDIADALMDALHAVHSANIIHRDLKPQNVFVCANGDVKLLDFGVARILENTKSSNKMSLFGMVLGTPSFMSPEQAIGARDEVDHRADIWSLGATIFTALTGETVHLGPHVQAKLLAAGTVQARSISLVKQDLHPAIAAVIDTSLRFDKKDRFQSVDAFRRALREARRAAGLGDAAPVSIRAPASVRSPVKPASVRPSAPARAKRSTRPPARPLKTLAGIGIAPATKVPEAKRTLPYPLGEVGDVKVEPLAEHPAGQTGAVPVGIIRSPIPIASEPGVGADDAHDDDADPEESYPAVIGSVRADDTNALMAQLAPRRGTPFTWLASLALVALAIGGVAFFALGGDRTSSSTETTAAAAPATLTSASPDPVAVPTSTGMVIGDPPVADAGASPHHPVAPRQATAIQPWHQPWHPRSFSRNQATPSLPAPNPSTPEPAPATPAATASSTPADPFSTPE